MITQQIKSYRHWLVTMNYTAKLIYYDILFLEKLSQWLVSNEVLTDAALTTSTIGSYCAYLQKQRNEKTGQLLRVSTLQRYYQTLRRFSYYLSFSGACSFVVPSLVARNFTRTKGSPVLFSVAEIKALYAVTHDDVLGSRDRALLGVCYGCGCRKNEAVHLEVKDIDVGKQLLHIKKGKGYKERLVPIPQKVLHDLRTYIHHYRFSLLKVPTPFLFIGVTGNPLQGAGLSARLKKLCADAGLHNKQGLHSLRHSIATHLLHKGMPMCYVQQFLGHTSLDTTQIYTHLEDGII